MDATLNPTAHFLQVSEKFYPEFVEFDDQLRSGAQHLYITLFHYARKSGVCNFTQKVIARKCKDSIRTVQSHLKILVALRYLAIEQDKERPGCKSYRLILSARVRTFIALMMREKLAPDQTKNLHDGDENSAHSYKSNKSDLNTPLSPCRSLTLEIPPPEAQSAGGGIPFLLPKWQRLTPQRPLKNFSHSIRARKPGKLPELNGRGSGAAGSCLNSRNCWQPWLNSATRRCGRGKMAASFLTSPTGCVADAGWMRRIKSHTPLQKMQKAGFANK